LLDKGRKRGDEYKSAWKEAERTGEYLVARDMPEPPTEYEQQLLDQARYVLKGKFSKPYPLETWLIVYFDPQLFTPGWTSSPQTETLSFGIKILATAARSLGNPDKIKKISVLTNDGRIGHILS
jgi:hypothetical protein